MRNLTGVILSLVVVLALTGCDGRGQDMDLRANGKTLIAYSEVRYNRIYVALDPLAKALGLTVGFDPKRPENGVLIQREGRFIHLHNGQQDCHVGDKTVRLDAPAVYLDQKTHRPMVPVDFVARTFDAKVQYKTATRNTRAAILITPAP